MEIQENGLKLMRVDHRVEWVSFLVKVYIFFHFPKLSTVDILARLQFNLVHPVCRRFNNVHSISRTLHYKRLYEIRNRENYMDASTSLIGMAEFFLHKCNYANWR